MSNNESDNELIFLTEELVFPPLEKADEDGLLAVGGDLSVERLLLAYKKGIFPWYDSQQPIIWWSPNPRMVLFPSELKISKSMKTVLNSNRFLLTKNECFDDVVTNCANVKRQGQQSTWITSEMKVAYSELHKIGVAKSYEVWENNKLIGGLYGIDLGHVFCGESMFSTTSNASKFAFIKMVQELQSKNYEIIDCQVYTDHLASLGAREIPRNQFVKILQKN